MAAEAATEDGPVALPRASGEPADVGPTGEEAAGTADTAASRNTEEVNKLPEYI